MAEVTIYHNPNCSKSRAVLAIIEESKRPYRVIPYLEEPLSLEQLKDLCRQLNLPLRAVMRTDVPAYDDLGLADEHISEEALFSAIAQHPALLNRPIVVTDKGAALCRPIETVYHLL